MTRVAAGSDATEVVAIKTLRNRSDEQLVAGAMDQQVLPLEDPLPIPVRVGLGLEPWPDPAVARKVRDRTKSENQTWSHPSLEGSS